jgi:hypothetical protein
MYGQTATQAHQLEISSRAQLEQALSDGAPAESITGH